MAKQIDIQVKESESELKKLISKQKTPTNKSRVRMLLLVKQKKVTYTKDLVPRLKVCRRTIYSWMSIYAQYGLKELLASKKRGGNTPVIEERTKVAIAEKLADPLTTMTSYVELLDWVHREYQSNVKYTTLHKHCREHHNSTLKVSKRGGVSRILCK